MKNIYFIFLMFSPFILFAQVPNDACSGAISLGTLPTPTACVNGAGGIGTAITSNGLTNINAIPESPYGYIANCSVGGPDMGNPAADVWYSFVPTGNTVNITLSGNLNTLNIGLYEGSCNNLLGRDCGTGAGNVSITVAPVSPGNTYYIQVSGDTITDVGTFSLTLNNNNGCDQCLRGATLSAIPAPLNGKYSPGQTVNFCFTVDNWNQLGANWFHAVQPIMSSNWLNINPVSSPSSCDGLGVWNWYASSTSSATGATITNAFVYDSPSGSPFGFVDGNPGNNYGDNCTGTPPWQFCWSAVTPNCPPGIQGLDLGAQIETYGDGQSGSWTSFSCTGDPAYTFNASLACCLPPIMSGTNETGCPGNDNGSATATATGTAGPWDYEWRGPSGSVILIDNNNNGPSSMNNLAPGTYVVSVTDTNGCTESGSYTVITAPDITWFTYNFYNCDPIGGTYSIGGFIDYLGAPSSGTITIRVNNGVTNYDTIINSPFLFTDGIGGNTDDVPWSISGIPANGASSSVAVWFSGGTLCGDTLYFSAPIPPNANAGLDDSICSLSYNLNATPSIGTGLWSGSAGVNFVNNTDPNTTVSVPTGGSYELVWVEDNGGCADLDTVVISFSDIEYSQMYTNPSCGNSDGEIIFSGSSGVLPYTYSIDNGITTQSNGTFSGIPSGVYTILIADDIGCTSTGTITLIDQGIAVIDSVTSTNATCYGNCDGSITIYGTGIDQYSVNNGTSFQSGNIFSLLCAGSFDITVQDAGGCPTIGNSITITQPAEVIAQTGGSDTTCSGDTLLLTALGSGGSGGAYTYVWDTTNANQNNLVFPSFTTNYCVVVTDNSGCSSLPSCETVTVETLAAIPISVVSNPLLGCLPVYVEFIHSAIPNSWDCSWDFGDGSAIAYNCAQDAHIYTDTGEFTVALYPESIMGCYGDTSYLTFEIIELCGPYLGMPTIFTPDGDGSNDLLTPVAVEQIESMETRIFNRWGKEVFRTDDLNINWDGTVGNGTKASNGVYYWTISLTGNDGTQLNRKGHITLVY